jgi:hypothetical protein
MMPNNPRDFDRPRALAQFDALVTSGRGITERLLTQERPSQDCFVTPARVQALGRSTVDAQGQRAAALRFGDQRVMALMVALAQWAHLPGGLTSKTLRQAVAALLGVADYSSAQVSYDLRRRRLTGLLERRPKSQT